MTILRLLCAVLVILWTATVVAFVLTYFRRRNK